MCRIYAGTAPAEYEPVSRSLRLHGAVTSIRLEARFWAILDEMAEAEGLTTPKFIAKLHDEVLDLHGDVRNFTSLLRVVCAVYLGRSDRVPDRASDVWRPRHSARSPKVLATRCDIASGAPVMGLLAFPSLSQLKRWEATVRG